MNTTPEAVSNGLALVSIPVKDQERSKRFYNEVLGFPIAREADFRPDARWIELSIPGTQDQHHAGDLVREYAARLRARYGPGDR